jgi:hypothetical protein
MNFDGKAYVKNISTKSFSSEHGYAFVREPVNTSQIHPCKGKDEAFVYPTYMTNFNVLKEKIFYYSNGLIPHTVQVYNEKENKLDTQNFIVTRDANIHNEQNFDYKTKRTYVSRIQPTNIKYNPKSVIVIDLEHKESSLAFASTTVNVNSKVQVVIPEKSTDYSDMSLVIQKNSFIEIKVPDGVMNIINLPEQLTYLPGYIKGTFTKSGEYNIKIKYPDGEQILNIIVPYYKRIL